jgi:hypothetical protein
MTRVFGMALVWLAIVSAARAADNFDELKRQFDYDLKEALDAKETLLYERDGANDRTEFLPEAKLYATAGAVSLLIDYPWVRPAPWRKRLKFLDDPENDHSAFVQAVIDPWRLWGRQRAEYTQRYPELDMLRRLPAGTLARRCCPVHYLLFDLLYYRGHCLLQEPLRRRRDVLAEACRRLDVAEVYCSEALVGPGKALYAAALVRGHEGIVAKHLAST